MTERQTLIDRSKASPHSTAQKPLYDIQMKEIQHGEKENKHNYHGINKNKVSHHDRTPSTSSYEEFSTHRQNSVLSEDQDTVRQDHSQTNFDRKIVDRHLKSVPSRTIITLH